ncbi:unnamed protein product [Acanthosepion pharaonis]|uniref:Uncharacterized protein n=1 Tax=Acanthosepion pharaonis TaxID=158019 RepID=A0A812D6N6_ACAPH|nr:unnamed protein product [Sepia pharaonis]
MFVNVLKITRLSFFLSFFLSISLSFSHSLFLPLSFFPSLFLSLSLFCFCSLFGFYFANQIYFYSIHYLSACFFTFLFINILSLSLSLPPLSSPSLIHPPLSPSHSLSNFLTLSILLDIPVVLFFTLPTRQCSLLSTYFPFPVLIHTDTLSLSLPCDSILNTHTQGLTCSEEAGTMVSLPSRAPGNASLPPGWLRPGSESAQNGCAIWSHDP